MTEDISNRIDSFSGAYRFLSNFYPCRPGLIWLHGSLVGKFDRWFSTTEHAFQASKSLHPEDWEAIWRCNTPGEAKRLGRTLALRSDWDSVKQEVMFHLLRQKFSRRSPLRAALLRTGDAELIEGNNWGDVYWGVCDGVGENHLGRLLMLVRWQITHPEMGLNI